MSYDYQSLLETSRRDPGSLTADQKNYLLEVKLGEPLSPAREAIRGTVVQDGLDLYSQRAAGSLVESGPGWDSDPDVNLSGVSGARSTRRLTKDANRKDLTPMEQEKMLRISAWLWDRNPLAARVITRAVNYILAEGVSVVAKHEEESVREEIQKAIDAFWFDPRNDMERRIVRWCTDYRAYGELILKSTVNEQTGLVRLAFVSPELVREVETEKNDIEIPSKLRILEKDGDSKGTPYDIIRIVEDPEREVGMPGRLEGVCHFFAANTLSDMVRGRSDLLRMADLLDAYDQFIWNRLERQAMLMAFVWSVELQGATQDQVDDWVRKNGGTPRPGSIQAHSDRVKWTPLTPDLGASEAATESDLMLSVIATTEGMPAMWFGKESDPNRANGENLTGPTLKDMTGLQKEFRHVIATIVRHALDQAIVSGFYKGIPKDLDTRKAFDVQFPELSVNDLSKVATQVSTMATGLTFARTNQLIDLKTAQEAFVQTLAPILPDIDLEAMRKNIEGEQAERDKKAEEMMYAQPGAGAAGAMQRPGAARAGGAKLLPGPGAKKPPPMNKSPDGSERRAGGV